MLDLLTRTGSYSKNEHRLTAAENILVGECMAGKGFWYPHNVDDFVPLTAAEQTVGLEERRRDGFGLFRAYSGNPAEHDGGPDRELPAVEEYLRRLSPERQAAYSQAMVGAGDARQKIRLPGGGEVTFPTTGCLAEARGQIFGDLLVGARVAYVPEALDSRLAEHLDADPAYVEAEKMWRACMKGRGYAYQRPGDGYVDLNARYQKEGPSQRLRQQEIAVAVADAECAQRAKIPSVVREAKLRGVRTLSEVEQQALRELTGSWLSAVAAAEEVADRSPERQTR